MSDTLIIGGGAIGLSLALELAEQGEAVQVLDRQPMGREASWAGAGMIPPGEIHLANPQYRQLASLSAELWPGLAEKLKESTGVDAQYLPCGALIFGQAQQSADRVAAEIQQWREQGIIAEALTAAEVQKLEPAVNADNLPGYFLPGQSQVRNPRYMQALQVACQQAGVRLIEGAEVQRVHVAADAVQRVETSQASYTAGRFVWATGSWSNSFSGPLQWSIPVEPVRGQIVLFQTSGKLKRIVEQGKHYLVPRQDGRVLVGSTEEHVEFDRQPNAARVQELQEFGQQFYAEIGGLTAERSWCGFRPMTPDKLPILGQLPNWQNAYVATGHYRAGLSLSPGTALLMRQLLLDQPLSLPIDNFTPDRFTPITAP